jgi:hypothetical protein
MIVGIDTGLIAVVTILESIIIGISYSFLGWLKNPNKSFENAIM